MTSAPGAPFAPPPFPAHPDTAAPPAPLCALRKTVTPAGSFLVTNGSLTVKTSANQTPAVSHLDVVRFAPRPGVYYTFNTVGPTAITLFAAYSGPSGDGKATKVVAAPATVAALYSTSPLDTDVVATMPAIPAGSRARAVSLTYRDSTGAGTFTVVTSLTGSRPAVVALAVGSVDAREHRRPARVGRRWVRQQVGQITLCELAAALPPVPSNATAADFGALTDQAQLLVARARLMVVTNCRSDRTCSFEA